MLYTMMHICNITIYISIPYLDMAKKKYRTLYVEKFVKVGDLISLQEQP